MTLIDPPAPNDPIEDWREFLADLLADEDQSDESIRLNVELANEAIARLEAMGRG